MSAASTLDTISGRGRRLVRRVDKAQLPRLQLAFRATEKTPDSLIGYVMGRGRLVLGHHLSGQTKSPKQRGIRAGKQSHRGQTRSP